MKRVYIYCEGQTEEAFVNAVLYPYFQPQDIYVFPIICTTKRSAGQKFRGGVTDYGKIRRELQRLCRSHPQALVTTMIDYYAMPPETPGLDSSYMDLMERIAFVERAVTEDIGETNCSFNFLVHEFEAVLFSRPEVFELITTPQVVEQLEAVRQSYPTPEHINNSVETAPSKRILSLIPQYRKVGDGVSLAELIGIDAIRESCPHFRAWTDVVLRWH